MILYGAGGHSKVIIEILESMQVFDITLWEDIEREHPWIWQYPIVKPDPAVSDSMIIAIGSNAARKKLAEKHAATMSFATGIHTDAYLSKRATVGEGTVVMAGVRVNADTRIGKHCIINTCASIDHDCLLGDYVHISPNATLAGTVEVGEGTHIGTGATVINGGIKIGKWCTIGAGAVVIRDVPDYSTAVGCPAKVIKTKIV